MLYFGATRTVGSHTMTHEHLTRCNVCLSKAKLNYAEAYPSLILKAQG